MTRKMIAAVMAAALFTGLAVTDGFAQRGGGGGGGGHGRGGHGGGFGDGHGRGFVGGSFLPTPVTPQFNDPGPQFAVPQPGNPVQQLSPLPGLGG